MSVTFDVENSYGKCLKYDVKIIRLVPPSGQTGRNIGYRLMDSCSPNRILYGEYSIYAVATKHIWNICLVATAYMEYTHKYTCGRII